MAGTSVRSAFYTDANGDRVDITLQGGGNGTFKVALAGGLLDNADATSIELNDIADSNALSIRVTPQQQIDAGSAVDGGVYSRIYSSGYTNIDRIYASSGTSFGSLSLSGASVKSIALAGVDVANITLDTGYTTYVDKINTSILGGSSSIASSTDFSNNQINGNSGNQAVLDFAGIFDDQAPLTMGTSGAYAPVTGLIDLHDVSAKSIGSLVINGAISSPTGDPFDKSDLTNDIRGVINVTGSIGSIKAARSRLNGTIRAGSIGAINIGRIDGTIQTTDSSQALTITLPYDVQGFIKSAGHLNLAYTFEIPKDATGANQSTPIANNTLGEITSGGGISGILAESSDTIFIPDMYAGVVINTSANADIAAVSINGTAMSRWKSNRKIGNITANTFAASMLVEAATDIGDIEAYVHSEIANQNATAPQATPLVVQLAGNFKAGGNIGNVKSATSIAADLRAGGSIGNITAQSGGILSNLIEAGGSIGNLWAHQNNAVNAGKIVAKAGNIGDLYLGIGDWGSSLSASGSIGQINLAKGNLSLPAIKAGTSIGTITIAGRLLGGSVVAGDDIGQVEVTADRGAAIQGVLIQAGSDPGDRIVGIKATSLGSLARQPVTPGLLPAAASTEDAIASSQFLAAELGTISARSHGGRAMSDTVIHAQRGNIDAISGVGNQTGLLRVTAVAEQTISEISGTSEIQGDGISQSRFNANSDAIGNIKGSGGAAGGHGIATTYFQAKTTTGDITAASNANQGDAIHKVTAYSGTYGRIKATVLGGEGAAPAAPPPPFPARLPSGNGIVDSYFKGLVNNDNPGIREISVTVHSIYGQGISNSEFAVKGSIGATNVSSYNNTAIVDSRFSTSSSNLVSVTAEAINRGAAILRSSFAANNGNIGAINATTRSTSGTDCAIDTGTFSASNNIGVITAYSRGGSGIKGSTFTADSDLSSSGAIDAIKAISEGQNLALSAAIIDSTFMAESIGKKVNNTDTTHGITAEIRDFEGGAGISNSTFTSRTATYDGMGNFDNKGIIGDIIVKNASRTGNGIERSRFYAGAAGRIGNIDVDTNASWDEVTEQWELKTSGVSGKAIYLSTFQASSFDPDQNVFAGTIGNITVKAGRVQPVLLPTFGAPNDQSTLAVSGIDLSYFAAYGGIGDLDIQTIGTAVFGSAFLADFDLADSTNLAGLALSEMAASVKGSIGDITIKTNGRYASGSVASIFTGSSIGSLNITANAINVKQAPQQLPTGNNPLEKSILSLIRSALVPIRGAKEVFDSVLSADSRFGLAAVIGSVFAALDGSISNMTIRNTGASKKAALYSIFLAKEGLGTVNFVPNLKADLLTKWLADLAADVILRPFGFTPSNVYGPDGVLLAGKFKNIDSDVIVNDANTVDATLSMPPATRSYRSGSTLDLTVNFGGPVVVTGHPTIAIKVGTQNRVATYVSGSGTSSLIFRYVVQAGDAAKAGEVVVTKSIKTDKANRINYRTGNTPIPNITLGELGSSRSLVVDAIAPRITAFKAPTSIVAKVGSVISVTVEFDDIVNVSGMPFLEGLIGSSTKPVRLTYARGSGTNALTFRYVVSKLDLKKGSDFKLQQAAILLGADPANAGRITDRAGNLANLR